MMIMPPPEPPPPEPEYSVYEEVTFGFTHSGGDHIMYNLYQNGEKILDTFIKEVMVIFREVGCWEFHATAYDTNTHLESPDSNVVSHCVYAELQGERTGLRHRRDDGGRGLPSEDIEEGGESRQESRSEWEELINYLRRLL